MIHLPLSRDLKSWHPRKPSVRWTFSLHRKCFCEQKGSNLPVRRRWSLGHGLAIQIVLVWNLSKYYHTCIWRMKVDFPDPSAPSNRSSKRTLDFPDCFFGRTDVGRSSSGSRLKMILCNLSLRVGFNKKYKLLRKFHIVGVLTLE